VDWSSFNLYGANLLSDWIVESSSGRAGLKYKQKWRKNKTRHNIPATIEMSPNAFAISPRDSFSLNKQVSFGAPREISFVK